MIELIHIQTQKLSGHFWRDEHVRKILKLAHIQVGVTLNVPKRN